MTAGDDIERGFDVHDPMADDPYPTLAHLRQLPVRLREP